MRYIPSVEMDCGKWYDESDNKKEVWYMERQYLEEYFGVTGEGRTLLIEMNDGYSWWMWFLNYQLIDVCTYFYKMGIWESGAEVKLWTLQPVEVYDSIMKDGVYRCKPKLSECLNVYTGYFLGIEKEWY